MSGVLIVDVGIRIEHDQFAVNMAMGGYEA